MLTAGILSAAVAAAAQWRRENTDLSEQKRTDEPPIWSRWDETIEYADFYPSRHVSDTGVNPADSSLVSAGAPVQQPRL